MPKLLVVGLDGSGKTSMIKRLRSNLGKGEADFFTSTAYIAVEEFKMPNSSRDCLVYDMSG